MNFTAKLQDFILFVCNIPLQNKRFNIGFFLAINFLFSRWQWEAKVTQYERDFERVSATVRKEVIRFEVLVSNRAECAHKCQECSLVLKCFPAITERKSQEVQKSDH